MNIISDSASKLVNPRTLINITGEDIYYGGTYISDNEIDKNAPNNSGSGGKGIIYNQMYPDNSTGQGGSGLVIIRFNRILNRLEFNESKTGFIRAKDPNAPIQIDLTDLSEFDIDMTIKINRKICNDNLSYIINKYNNIESKLNEIMSSNSIEVLNELYKDVINTKKESAGYLDIIYEKTTQVKILAENIPEGSIIRTNMINIANDIIDTNNDGIYYYSVISVLFTDVGSIIDIRRSIININNYDIEVDKLTAEIEPLKDLIVITLKVNDAVKIGDLAITERDKAISAYNTISPDIIQISKITPDYQAGIKKGDDVKTKTTNLFNYYCSIEYNYYNIS